MEATFPKGYTCDSVCLFVCLDRNGQKGRGEGGRGQVSAPLHPGSQAAPREETLHWGLLLDPRCKTLSDHFYHRHKYSQRS